MRATAVLLSAIMAVVGATASGCGQRGVSSEPASGIAGVVRLGPQCPVARVGRPCPDVRPAGVTVVISIRLPGEPATPGARVAETSTDAKGRFRVAVPPGAYVVTAQAGMACGFVRAVVRAAAFAAVSVPCDTGIR